MLKIIIFIFLTFSLHPSSFDIQKFLELQNELQNKIIEYSEINQCFSMNNEEYQNVFNFLSIDYYLKDPNLWTHQEVLCTFPKERKAKLQREHSFRNTQNLASWLDTAIHCFFYNEAMDLIIASECRKIRNGQTKI